MAMVGIVVDGISQVCIVINSELLLVTGDVCEVSKCTSESETETSLIRESTDGSSSVVGRTKELRVKIE